MKAVLEDPVRLGEAAFHVSARDLLVAAHVAASVLYTRLCPIFGIALVKHRCVRRHGLRPRGDRGKHVVVHLDEPRGFLRGLLVHRCHRGDPVAHVADLGAGEVLFVADKVFRSGWPARRPR